MSKDIYKEAYQREVQARKEAERLLDEKTRALYDNVLKLEDSNRQLAVQADELKLLIDVASFTQNELSFLDGLALYQQAVAKLIKAPWGVVYLPLKNKVDTLVMSDIRYTMSDDFSPELYHSLENSKFCIGESTPGAVLESGEPLLWDISENIDLDPQRAKILQKLQIKGVLAVPIKRFGKVVAVAEFYLQGFESTTDSTIEKVNAASIQLGVALERRMSQQKLTNNYAKLKMMHQQLKQAQNQLIQSEKMGSLGQIAAGVAHEINNPIGFVTSNMDTLHDYCRVFTKLLGYYKNLEQVTQNNDKKSIVKIIGEIESLKSKEDIDFIIEDLDQVFKESVDGLYRTRDIVSNLKSFARVDEGDMQEVDINDCLDSTLKIIWNELKYTVDIHKNYGELPIIKCNGGQVSQVFMNIIMNAKHACGEKGRIDLDTTCYDNKEIHIKIKDDGCGMPQAVVDKIFDPFFTTKPVGTGTGLGMSVSYGIIENHKGRIDVTSKEGVGSVFTIVLPTQL